MVFYKSISVVLLFALIFTVYGKYDPDSEIEDLNSKVSSIKDLKNKLEEIAKETTKLRSQLEATKNNLADGPNSNSNIKKLIEEIPEKVGKLTDELISTMKALEKKELLA